MLIHNHSLDGGENHGALIKRLLAESDSADLMVSYVKSTGADFLTTALENIQLRLLCAREMDITDPQALIGLANTGAEIKIYECVRGNFHPKMWLFYSGGKPHACVVGSANMSAGAFLHNVEVGALFGADHIKTLEQAQQMFNFFWGKREALPVAREYLEEWSILKQRRAQTINEFRKLQAQHASEYVVNILEENPLKEYVGRWMHINVAEETPTGTVRGKLWRGWYIIPDQGMIDGGLMNRLHRICQIIHSAGGRIDMSSESSSPQLQEICGIVKSKLQRDSHRTPLRNLFVRQEKNYLEKFGFVVHPPKADGKPDSKTLQITTMGKAFAEAETAGKQKKVYTEAMDSYAYNGLPLLLFVKQLLAITDYVTNEEFGLFANHAYSLSELDIVASLTLQYRALQDGSKEQFNAWYSDLFKQILEPTNKNVRGNYDKSVRHTLSALGWCEGLRYGDGKITADDS